MKSRAGGRLCHRKPSSEPTITRRKPPTKSCGSWVTGSGAISITAASIPPAIAATPAESPSMLSSMLNELTSPTIQRTLRGIVNQGASRNSSSRQPDWTTMAATSVWTPSRTFQPSPQRSSIKPRIIRTVPPPSRIHNLDDSSSRPGRCLEISSGSHRAQAAWPSPETDASAIWPTANGRMIPSQIAKPPQVGIGLV